MKGKSGHELFKNLFRGEGIRLISLFWKKKLLKDGNGRWVRCGFFLKVLIVSGGEDRGLYFFTFFIFMFVIFWDLLLLKGGRGGLWGFFIKKSFFVINFFDCLYVFCYFFHFRRRKVGHGFKVNKYCIY